MLFGKSDVLVVGFVWHLRVCMCENPVGYLGLLGVFGFKWVCLGFSFSILAFLCVCAYGYEGRKV